MMHPLLTIRSALKRCYAHEMAGVLSRWQLTKSHVSKAVEHLTALGLVLQQRDEMNRRRIHLKLATAAEPILREGREAQKRFVEALTRGLSDEDKTAAARILTVMLKNAAALGQEA